MPDYKKGYLSDFFEGYAVKRLTAVEVDPDQSNQHEFQGIQEMRKLLGTPSQKETIETRFLWLDDAGENKSVDSFVTWSNVRRNNPARSPEYHLYYFAESDPIVHKAKPGDLLLVCKQKTGGLIIVFAQAESTTERQLAWLFDFPLEEHGKVLVNSWEEKESKEIDFAARFILDELGIESAEGDEGLLEMLIGKFGPRFPSTAEFSAFARNSKKHISEHDSADTLLLSWMDHEEMLFRTLEKHLVTERLRKGFYDSQGADVDGFISFSLSVQNRRKSRAGFALENHLEYLFNIRKIRFTKGARTEYRSRPDFLFPGEKEYHNPSFPGSALTVLGAKSSCKDRWRQVLSEAAKIKKKHLLTLEPGISENQTDEMQGSNVQLVIPRDLHNSYSLTQQGWLYNLEDFIKMVLKKQGSSEYTRKNGT